MEANDKHVGIVPSIEKLRVFFDDVSLAINNYLNGKITREQIGEIGRKIEAYSHEMQELPDTLNRSYELIQMVIQSIHTSRSELKKSVDGLIKKTGMQLQKVTSTTEEATNKILDVAEKLDEDQMKIIALLDDIEAKTASGEIDASAFEEIKTKVYQNQESAFLIMDYLQFQDITAQQIAGAYSLLSDTEKTLLFVSDMLKRFDTDRQRFESAIREIDKRSFNEDASFGSKKVLQEAIDDLFETGEIHGDLLEKEDEPETPAPEKKDGDKGDATQDDIDALFNNASQEKTSQDEIDKLFS